MKIVIDIIVLIMLLITIDGWLDVYWKSYNLKRTIIKTNMMNRFYDYLIEMHKE